VSNSFLTSEDLRLVVTRLPMDVRKLMMKADVILGGGFIRETIAGNQPKDIDLFGSSGDVLRIAAELLCVGRQGRKYSTDNAITVLSGNRMPVQFILRWLFAQPSDVVESFDFTVCQAAIWYDKKEAAWKSVISAGFYPDLAARRLVYTFPRREEEAGGSMLRVRKFLQRGYSIQAPSLAGVIARIAMAVRWDEIARKNGDGYASERSVALIISGLLREVDPNITVDGLDVVDEHEAINAKELA